MSTLVRTSRRRITRSAREAFGIRLVAGRAASGTLDDRSYNGTGNYSYFPASGGEVTGNLNESGQRVSYTAAAWALALDAAGDWVTDNGTSTTTANTQDQLDYSGGGSYGPAEDPTVDHGAVIESGASASGTNYVVTALWNPGSSAWVNSSGSGSGNDTGYDYSFYLGSHTYTHPSDIYNNSVNGTVDDSGTTLYHLPGELESGIARRSDRNYGWHRLKHRLCSRFLPIRWQRNLPPRNE